MTALELITKLSEFDLNVEIVVKNEQGQEYEIYDTWVFPEYDKQKEQKFIVIGISEF